MPCIFSLASSLYRCDVGNQVNHTGTAKDKRGKRMLAAINLSTRDHIKVTGEEAQRLKTTLTGQAHF